MEVDYVVKKLMFAWPNPKSDVLSISNTMFIKLQKNSFSLKATNNLNNKNKLFTTIALK